MPQNEPLVLVLAVGIKRKIEKGFKNNYQHTAIEITPQGIDAFETYVTVLKEYLDPS